MMQFKLNSMILALHQLISWLIRLFCHVKNTFPIQSQKRSERQTNAPSHIESSKSSVSSSSFFSNLSSSSEAWSSTNGEFIGTESGVHEGSTEDLLQLTSNPRNANPYYRLKRSLKQRCEKKIKAYPPALPTKTCRSSIVDHYTWGLSREYIDGRLVLKEVIYERHEYLEIKRMPCRLVINRFAMPDSYKSSRKISMEEVPSEG